MGYELTTREEKIKESMSDALRRDGFGFGCVRKA